ncbi:MAG: aminopeptidase N [Alphaproteobacteria bacterium]|nr:aminopeptidase N [Alphaproteobacteria bacterium]
MDRQDASAPVPQVAPRAILRADYAPPAYRVDRVDLVIKLFPDRAETHARMEIERGEGVADGTPLVLDGQNMDLRSVRIDGDGVAQERLAVGAETLTVSDVPARFVLETEVVTKPQENTALEGLYLSSGVFTTQCEAEGFRRITYFVDRPDNMALFTTRIEAGKACCPVLLSNGNLVESGDLPEGRHYAVWDDPFRKPSYLFALVAGDLAEVADVYTTGSGRKVDLKIFVEHGNEDRCGHAMESLKRSMRWDEERYGLEYDLDIFNIVAVSDFNMGAMENKSLNVFNSKYVLAKPETATDTDFQLIEGIVAHEYFHNWTGNRVTCRDWFQLSLKEGLTVFRDQEFSADMSEPTVKRISDVMALRASQFPEDAGPMAHPIRPDSYIEINNFYTATVYEKGAEVVRMYQTLLGRDGFRKGMDLYFKRHDGQAVTCDDFRAAMADANEADLEQFGRWYAQAGTPVVTAKGDYDAEAQRYTLTVTQHTPPTPGQDAKEPLVIPLAMGLIGGDSGRALNTTLEGENAPREGTRTLMLTEAKSRFTFVDVPEAPVPSLNRGFSAPIKLESDLTIGDLLFLMAHDSDPFNRWEAGQTVFRRMLSDMVCTVRDGGTPAIDPAIQDALATLLADDSLDPAFLTVALAVPGEGDVAKLMPEIDMDAIAKSCAHVRANLFRPMAGLLRALHDRLSAAEPDVFTVTPEAIGRRSLKNSALMKLAAIGDDGAEDRARAQYDGAGTMTDSLAALRAVNDSDSAVREDLLGRFERRWSNDPLVMDKWFGIQAISRREDTLAKVQGLMSHPGFTMRNPNRVRSLIGAFAAGNPVRFHAADGAGYRFLTDRLLELDPANPQVAARLFMPFQLWTRHEPGRRAKMRAEIARIVETEGLSKDLFEQASKALRAGG